MNIQSESADLPLLPAQARMLQLEQVASHSKKFHIAAALRLVGELDVLALTQVVGAVQAAHPALRTCIIEAAGVLAQRVLSAQDGALSGLGLESLDGLPAAARESFARAQITAEAVLPFQPGTALFRARLLRIARHDHWLLLTVHRCVADEWSMSVVMSELCTRYLHVTRAQQPPALDSAWDWAGYVLRQHSRLCQDADRAWLQALRDRLRNRAHPLQPPTDDVVTANTANRLRGARPIALPAAVAARLRQIASDGGVRPRAVLMAAYGAIAAHWAASSGFVIVTTVRDSALASIIGPLEQKIAVTVDMADNPDFGQLVQRVDVAYSEALAMGELPLAGVTADLWPPLGHGEGAQVALHVLEDAHHRLPELPGLEVEAAIDGGPLADEALSLFMRQSADGWEGALVYAALLFHASTIEQQLRRLVGFLCLAADQPAIPVLNLLNQLPAEAASVRQLSAEVQVAGGGNSAHAAAKLQSKLAVVWARALGLAVVGLDEHFFDLGGHSLMLPAMQKEIEQITGLELEIGMILQYPSVRKFSAYCSARLWPANDGRALSRQERWRRRDLERRATT